MLIRNLTTPSVKFDYTPYKMKYCVVLLLLTEMLVKQITALIKNHKKPNKSTGAARLYNIFCWCNAEEDSLD